jgi:protease PrsW
MDGVVYGTAVGLGFAALENVLYVAGGGAGWEGIAMTRGVLSVPFHGALGAIAGAYIAMARFGGALGARSHSPGRRTRLLALAWLIPVVLHSAFDSLLFLVPVAQKDPTAGNGVVALLILGAIAVGLGAMTYAFRLARRIARHQKISLETKRLPPAHWRGVWAECIIGVGLSFVALALGIAGGSGFGIAGWILLAVAAGMARRCGKRLNASALRRVAVPSS